MQGNAFKVAILGGGPAGIAAALMIRHISDYDVYLFDANPKIGRKLSVTGSGRCNLTNLELDPERYYSTQPADLSSVLSCWSPADLRLFFDRIGLPTTATDDGWVYPQSFSAANVVQILSGNLIEHNVHLVENTKVSSIILCESISVNRR
jgi:predicted flavoprotein YhiN